MKKSLIKLIKSTRKPALLAVLATLVVVCVQAAEWRDVQKQREFVVTVSATGVVDSEDFVSIGAPPTTRWRSRIESIVPEGKRVRKGEIVVQIEGSRTDERIRELESELNVHAGDVGVDKEQKEQQVRQEALNMSNLKADVEKAIRLAEVPAGIVPGIEYRKLLERRRLAETRYDRALFRKTLSDRDKVATEENKKRQIARAELRLTEAKRALDSFTIRAPKAGIAVIGTGWNGEKLTAGSSASGGIQIVKIVNDEKLLIRATIPENLATVLKVDQRAIIVTETTGTAELSGRVHSVGNTVRRKSPKSLEMVRDFTVKLDEDYSEILRIGVSVEVKVEVQTFNDVLVVPKAALVYKKGKPGVVIPGFSIGGFVLTDKWSGITLGKSSQDYFIVKEGLAEGQRVRL
ncbi:MAG: hypothetical protein F4W92_02630 [Gammaproteobacteria bacterium]|nr:hypothetical protein [Gammaproteobacteria bacterium]